MDSGRVRKLSIWRPLRGGGADSSATFGGNREQSEPTANPWIETQGFSFSPKDISVVNRTVRRKRTFTGTIRPSQILMPGVVHNRKMWLRLGIALFFVFDLLLMVVFLRTLM